jgi:hypothetical protein
MDPVRTALDIITAIAKDCKFPVFYNGRLILTHIKYEDITLDRYLNLTNKNPQCDFICDGDNKSVMIVDNGKKMVFG